MGFVDIMIDRITSTISARASLALLLPVVVAIVAWESGPDLPVIPMTQTAEETWSLAAQVNPDRRRAYEFLSTANIWGNVEVAKKEEDERDPAWRFLAVLTNGSEKFVVIDVEKQPNRQLRIGDKFPGGARISQINQDSVCVIINGKKRLLPIYPQDRQIL